MMDAIHGDDPLIADIRRDEWRAGVEYVAALTSLRTACIAAGFEDDQLELWTIFYGGIETDIATLAKRMKTSQENVRELLFGIGMNARFCTGIDKVARYAEDFVDVPRQAVCPFPGIG